MSRRYRKYLKDILRVGPIKPLGYLPITTINLTGIHVDTLVEWAIKRGFCWRFISAPGYLSSLYVCDEVVLRTMLYKYRLILEAATIPTEPLDYVCYISTQIVSQQKFPFAYAVLGRTFNDHRFKSTCLKRLCPK